MSSHPRGFASAFFKILLLCLSVLGGTAPFPALRAEEQQHVCRYCSTNLAPTPATPDLPHYRKYTPGRRVEISHLALDITPDFKKRTIQGTVVIQFKPIATPLEEFRLDAVDLSIASTKSSEPGFQHQVTEKELVFTFSPPIPAGKESSVTVSYSVEPVKGLYFRTREMGYSATHLWTQGEPVESRHWFPSFDHPVEKFTSEVTCHLPEGMVALSNGRQVSATRGADGLTAFRWLQDKPHTNYLISLVAGELSKIEDKHGELPLEFWTTPDEIAQAPNSFRNTKNIMEFFEKEIGVKYPWAKYSQVAVQDYHWGGMENTSLTTLNYRTLFQTDTENLFDSSSLVAHELAHQWFGDLVTCRDWSHIWLNEGFATFYDWLWQGSFYGRDEMLYSLHNAAAGILGNTNETRGIVWRKYDEPGQMFNYLAYPKGAWVLHMLRTQLGPDLYRKCIRAYVEKHAYGSVTTDDLRSVIENISGRSFERFFDQWVAGIGAPALDVSYSWDAKTNLAKVSVKQTQKISEDAHLFQFPLVVHFVTKGAREERTLQVEKKEEDFYFPLKAAPEWVRVNPDLGVLAKINFKPGKPMLFLQLADHSDPVGQLVALEQLADKPDKEAVSKIKASLQEAKHYGVRVKAAEVLRQARSEEALEALSKSLSQTDARVRNAVVKALGGFYQKEALAALKNALAADKNPGIIATALRGLGPYQSADVQALLTSKLGEASYRERVSEAAIAAIKAQDDPRLAGVLGDFLKTRGNALPSPVLGAGLETLGSLNRNETNRGATRDFLESYLQAPKEQIRLAAITALGNLEDPRSIATLDTYAGASIYRPEKAVAEKALEKIRAAHKPSEELKALRTEVTNLQEAGREIKKEMETLRKKLEPARK